MDNYDKFAKQSLKIMRIILIVFLLIAVYDGFTLTGGSFFPKCWTDGTCQSGKESRCWPIMLP